MKKLLTALVICLYFVPLALAAVILLSEHLPELNPLVLLIFPAAFTLLSGVMSAKNIAAARARAKAESLPFKAVLTAKLCLIPFYVLNFVVWGIGASVFHTAFFVLPMLPFIIAYTWWTMLGTSAHAIAKLAAMRRDGTIDMPHFVILVLMQLTFVADVVGCVYLVRKEQKSL